MKTISILTAALMLTGIAQGYAGDSFSKKPKSTKGDYKDNNNKDRNNKDRNNRDRKNNNAAQPGPKGDKGERGERGLPGAPGVSSPIVYGYFYNTNNGSIENNEAVQFDTVAVEAGGVSLHAASGAIVIPESGDYQVSFLLHVSGEGAPAFGLQVNESEIVSGSVYRTHALNELNNFAQLNGSIITTFEEGDSLQVVNLSNGTLEFNNGDLAESQNASITVRKIN